MEVAQEVFGLVNHINRGGVRVFRRVPRDGGSPGARQRDLERAAPVQGRATSDTQTDRFCRDIGDARSRPGQGKSPGDNQTARPQVRI